jgi:hypothetical protein
LFEVNGIERIGEFAEILNLPPWWVEEVCVEYFPCRRFGKASDLCDVDFEMIPIEDAKK